MSEIEKLLNSLGHGVSSGELDESWLPYINRAMTELRELEATQHLLAPDICPECQGFKKLYHIKGYPDCDVCNGTGKRR